MFSVKYKGSDVYFIFKMFTIQEKEYNFSIKNESMDSVLLELNWKYKNQITALQRKFRENPF